jgi:site-specific DNA-methyltransferase (adenine-specific)
MPKLADKSVDMVLCDLPYGVTACKWDSIIPIELLWEQYKRIIKNNGSIVLTASQPFASVLVMSNMQMFKYFWYWIKSKGSNFVQAPNMPLKVVESVLVFSFGAVGHLSQCKKNRMVYNPQGTRLGTTIVKQNPNSSELKYHRDSHQQCKVGGYKCLREGYPTTVLAFKSENGLHPTQKPVALFEYLIRTYTNEGGVVLDNCAGSGTTGVACINANRRFILIEKDPTYCKLMRARIAAAWDDRNMLTEK